MTTSEIEKPTENEAVVAPWVRSATHTVAFYAIVALAGGLEAHKTTAHAVLFFLSVGYGVMLERRRPHAIDLHSVPPLASGVIEAHRQTIVRASVAVLPSAVLVVGGYFLTLLGAIGGGTALGMLVVIASVTLRVSRVQQHLGQEFYYEVSTRWWIPGRMAQPRCFYKLCNR